MGHGHEHIIWCYVVFAGKDPVLKLLVGQLCQSPSNCINSAWLLTDQIIPGTEVIVNNQCRREQVV